MEEADALSDRVGIIVGGNLKCLGTPQRLKSTYGDGYIVNFTTRTFKEAKKIVDRLLPEALMSLQHKLFVRKRPIDFSCTVERHIGSHCQVKIKSKSIMGDIYEEGGRGSLESGLALEVIFHAMNSLRDSGLIEFSVSQSTLQQVFIDFAMLQKD
jgi:ABC-type multidrug transport system ATPase subunit